MIRHVSISTLPIRLALALVLLAGVLAFATPAVTVSSAAALNQQGACGSVAHRTIQRGNRGKSVKHAQCLLNTYWGFNLRVDGIFGPRTEDAIEYVQDYAGLNSDGIVGRCTWPVLHLNLPPNNC